MPKKTEGAAGSMPLTAPRNHRKGGAGLPLSPAVEAALAVIIRHNGGAESAVRADLAEMANDAILDAVAKLGERYETERREELAGALKSAGSLADDPPLFLPEGAP